MIPTTLFPPTFYKHARLTLIVLAVLVVLLICPQVIATEVGGIVQANRQVDVAASESGVLMHLHVKAGQKVQKGEPIASLDDDVQIAQLELAEHLAASEAELVKARAELATQQSVHEHLVQLSDRGFAQPKELLRAKMELDIARASLLARQERVTENQVRLKLAELNVRRRLIVSPLSGVVSEIHREEGEFVSPLNPQIVTVLEVDPIIALFQVNVADVPSFVVNQPVKVTLHNGISAQGVVESIGVIAESETVALKVRLPNAQDQMMSGQRCYMQLPTTKQLSQR